MLESRAPGSVAAWNSSRPPASLANPQLSESAFPHHAVSKLGVSLSILSLHCNPSQGLDRQSSLDEEVPPSFVRSSPIAMDTTLPNMVPRDKQSTEDLEFMDLALEMVSTELGFLLDPPCSLCPNSLLAGCLLAPPPPPLFLIFVSHAFSTAVLVRNRDSRGRTHPTLPRHLPGYAF